MKTPAAEPKAPAGEPRVPFGILPSESVCPGDHIAYFWETEKEFEQGVNFLTVAATSQDHCVIFGHDEANQRVCDILQRHGVFVPDLQREGRLTIVGAGSTGEKILTTLATIFQQAVKRGAPLIRLLGNIGWGEPDWPGEDDILLFEAKVTEAAKLFPAVVVCMYDVRRLSGRVIVHGGLGTHPISVCGNVMRVNTYHQKNFDEFAARVQETATKSRR